MEEIVFWKEVTEPEPTEGGHLQAGYWCLVPAIHVATCGGDNCNIPEDNYKYFKRVVVNILSDQEIKDEASTKDCPKVIPPESFTGLGNPNADYYDRERQFWIKGYKAMQERLIQQ